MASTVGEFRWRRLLCCACAAKTSVGCASKISLDVLEREQETIILTDSNAQVRMIKDLR